MHEIYLYGSTLVTDSFILEGEFPKGNQYAEFIEHHTNIGGETGMCLAKLGTGAEVDRLTKLDQKSSA